MLAAELVGHIVVFGIRGVARRVVRQLSTTGHRIVVVAPGATQVERDELERWDVDYLAGSAQSVDTLRAARVCEALAVMCVTPDDLINIEVALLVREMSTQVRVVVQMGNASVAQALRPLVMPGAVYDAAELATTSIVEAALGRTTHRVALGGQDFLVSSFVSSGHGTFRSLWGDMTPVAAARAGGGPIVSCPSRDLPVAVGDRVTMMGTPEEFAAIGVHPVPEAATRPNRPWRRRAREALAAVNHLLDRPFRVTFAVLAVLGVISVAVLMGHYREPDGTTMTLLDAVYFTAETIATVGFGDFYFRDQTPGLRIWAIVITLLGATLITIVTALLTNTLVTRSLAQSLGRQRVTGMRGHIVVVGLGQVGSRVALQLHESGYEVAVIDGGQGRRFTPRMQAVGLPVLIGDPTLRETQLAAGVHRAAGLAVLTDDDLTNIEIGLAVRGLVGERRFPIVMRIFGRDLARVLAAVSDTWKPRSIAELAAPWFIGAALGMEVVGTFYVGSSPYMAARLHIRRGSGFDGLLVDDFRVHTRVAAIQRADGGPLEFPPGRQARLNAGDVAYVVGHYEDLFEVLAHG
ncbi:MAG: NAD-binding protein [Kineosporiaceae bacterium]|nr:NAD-binding protein [Kineosporiaceae bacterium]